MRKLAALVVGAALALALAAPALADAPDWNLYTAGESGGYTCNRGNPQAEGGTVFVSGPYETKAECEAAIPGDPDPEPSPSPTPDPEPTVTPPAPKPPTVFRVITRMPLVFGPLYTKPAGTTLVSVDFLNHRFIVTFSDGQTVVRFAESFRRVPTHLRVRQDGAVIYFGDPSGPLERRRG